MTDRTETTAKAGGAVEHTPGEWLIHGPSSGRGISDDGGDYAIYIERDGTKHIIAEAICQTRENNFEPAEANARLIAAAPDLLEALDFMFKAVDDGWLVRNIDNDGETDWAMKAIPYVQGLQKAHAALAKARGQS